MKKIFLLFLLLICNESIHAKIWVTPQSHSDWSGFLGGIASTIMLHETAHYVVAKRYGFDVVLDGVSVVYPNWQPTDSQQIRVASAGFHSQWLVSELAFRSIEKKGNTQFKQGLVMGHIVISAAYLLMLKDESTSDIFAISEVSNRSAGELAWALMLPAMLDSWRLLGNDVPPWVPRLSVASKGAGIVAAWSF